MPGTAAGVVTDFGSSTYGQNVVQIGFEVASFFSAANNDVDISVKGSAGYLLSTVVNNKNAALRYFMIFNKATAPANGDTPVAIFEIPAGSATAPSTLFLDDKDLGQGGYFCSVGVAVGISSSGVTFTAATTTDHVSFGRWV